MRTKLLALVALAVPVAAFAAGGGAHVEHAGNDITNTASLQRGARNFVNYCLGCHSAKYVRYNRLAADLGLSEEELVDSLMFTGERPFDTMRVGMNPDDARRWFGVQPPDLSLIARSRGTDYLYSFLRSFYLDSSKASGVNNLMLPGTAMPHVLWELQGYQEAVWEGEMEGEALAQRHFKEFKLAAPGTLTPEEYDSFVRDTVNFLEYIAEPVQMKRRSLGFPVIAFLIVFTLLAWALKKEYWKDVK